MTGQLYVQLQSAGGNPSWLRLLQIQLVRWWLWAALTPLLQHLARRWSPQRVGNARSATVIGTVALALLPLTVAYGMFIDLTVFQGIVMAPDEWMTRIARGSLVGIPVFAVIYGGIIGLTYASDFYLEYQLRQREAETLRAALAEARLQALQLQLQPHFLFNTLHTIATLMEEDVTRARRMTARLGDLLRATLEVSGESLVPLRDEVRLARRYLDIEKARFEERLQLAWEVADHLLDQPIPTLTLQPLVENAVRHGVSKRPHGGRVVVSAHRTGADLLLKVEDDGVGPPAAPRFGVGLSSIQERLTEQYGAAASLRLETNSHGGCTATVRLPCKT
ncbi:MAG: hypothetical protein GKS06_09730 [Acidobacteria bacterium]|nr:hypothetical protein [Acidobacteriota bacterium]